MLVLGECVDNSLRFFCTDIVKDAYKLSQYPTRHSVDCSRIKEIWIYIASNMSNAPIVSNVVQRQ